MSKFGQTTPIEVANPAFLLERLAADCAPLQEYRELTRNGIDAIRRRRESVDADAQGLILWDIDWALVGEGVYKLCCIDTGIGMTGTEIERYINHLSSSASRQSLDANFGIGARITAGHKNPAGLIYLSWQNGAGVTAQFWKDEEAGAYGLRRLRSSDGKWGNYTAAPEALAPEEIDGWGTKVVLMGSEDEEHTVLPPAVPSSRGRHAPGGMKWLTHYLNRRFFQFPEGVTVKVRELSYREPEKWPLEPATSVKAGAQLRAVEGAKHHLDTNSEANGSVQLEGAIVHWWLLKETTKSGTRSLAESREAWESRGHVAALYQDELYEMRRLNEGYRMLKMFGVTFGFERVVLYVEPLNGPTESSVTANTARSHLRLNGDSLPWVEWASEFRSKMPKALKTMMDDLLAASGSKDHLDAIKRRLKSVAEFLRVEKYRRSRRGTLTGEGDTLGGSPRADDGVKDTKGRSGGGKGGGRGNLYANLLEPEGDPVEPVRPRLKEPEVVWASLSNGLRAKGEMEDRAAAYEPETNVLTINRDFRVLTTLKSRFLDEAGDLPGTEEIVSQAVEEWIEQQLVEAVIGVRTTLEGSKHWAAGSKELETALSEEALTVAVMPRYHVITAIRRVLGNRLPKAKEASS